MSGALLLFFFFFFSFSRSHGLSENVSMCCVWGRPSAEKENILPSKPHATDSFWGQINQLCVSDHVTLFFLVLCVIPDISCFNPPPPSPPPPHSRLPFRHAHARTLATQAHSDFPFPVREDHLDGAGVGVGGGGAERRASAQHAQAGKTGRIVQGCPTCKARRVMEGEGTRRAPGRTPP